MDDNEIKLDINEVLRYLGVREDPDGAAAWAAAEEADRLLRNLRPRYVYRLFPIERGPEGDILKGSDVTLPGDMAGQMMAQCQEAALLACTLGAGFETMLRAAQARDMARAVILDACGSALVEAGCDLAERGPAPVGTGQPLRGLGRPKAAGDTGHREFAHEPHQIRHCRHWPGRQAPARPDTGLRILRPRRDVHHPQGRKKLC